MRRTLEEMETESWETDALLADDDLAILNGDVRDFFDPDDTPTTLSESVRQRQTVGDLR